MKTAKWMTLFIAVLLAAPAYGQVEEVTSQANPGAKPGTIYGNIRPPYGYTFQGATITLSDEKSGETRTTQANDAGDFEFKNLADGPYAIDVAPTGFAPAYRGRVPPGDGSTDFLLRPLMAWEPLAPVFTWAFNSGVGVWVRESTWAFAYLEVVHLLGLTVLLGSVVALGLRLSNLAMKSLPTAEVAREIRPYMLFGLAFALLSGVLMFAAEAEKLFISGPFQWKIAFFILANIFQFTAVSWLCRSREGSSLAFGKIAALLSVVFWYVVAWEGRAIAFF